VVLAKLMPIANVNRIVFVNLLALSVSQLSLSASLLQFGIYGILSLFI